MLKTIILALGLMLAGCSNTTLTQALEKENLVYINSPCTNVSERIITIYNKKTKKEYKVLLCCPSIWHYEGCYVTKLEDLMLTPEQNSVTKQL